MRHHEDGVTLLRQRVLRRVHKMLVLMLGSVAMRMKVRQRGRRERCLCRRKRHQMLCYQRIIHRGWLLRVLRVLIVMLKLQKTFS